MSTRSKEMREAVAHARACISTHGFETGDAYRAFFDRYVKNLASLHVWGIAAREAQNRCDAHGSKLWGEHRTVQ